MTQSLTIQSLDGLSLEAELDQPVDASGALVLCHPHPQMGGTMNAPLLLAVRDELVDIDWAVLRFNFRGIGSSQGTSQTGIDEIADARGALALMRERFPEVPVAIAGWSFGAAVALRTIALDHEIAAGVFIAPAIDERPGVTAGAPAPSEIEIVAPSLILCGTNDHLVDVDRCREWANQVPHITFMAMKGANHFFWGTYEALASAVVSFLQEAV